MASWKVLELFSSKFNCKLWARPLHKNCDIASFEKVSSRKAIAVAKLQNFPKMYLFFCVHFWPEFTVSFLVGKMHFVFLLHLIRLIEQLFLKMVQSRTLLCLFSFFSCYNFNTNWKKHRWCAWDSNPGLQDGRRRRNHRAMCGHPNRAILPVTFHYDLCDCLKINHFKLNGRSEYRSFSVCWRSSAA